MRSPIGSALRTSFRLHGALVLGAISVPAIAAPAPVVTMTSTRVLPGTTLEWVLPNDPQVRGTLVIGSTVPTTAVPRDGKRYRRNRAIAADFVACIVRAPGNRCTFNASATGTTLYFTAYTFDRRINYSPGVSAQAVPVDSSGAKWSYWSPVGNSITPVGAAGSAYSTIVGTRALHRMNTGNGLRLAWRPLSVDGAVLQRPMAGDLTPTAATRDYTAYFGTDAGTLYRFSLRDNMVGPIASRRVAGSGGDAGCTAGALRSGPVVLLDLFDANTNNTDDVVAVATACGVINNQLLLYSHNLSTLHDRYLGGSGGLGVSNAPPRLLYRDDADNLLYVPLHDDGGESLLVMRIAPGPSFGGGPYAVVSGVGHVDVTPIAFRRGNRTLLVFGNHKGTLYLTDALQRQAGDGSALLALGSRDTGDGPVRGLAVSGRIGVSGGFENWVTWITNTAVHGIKVASDATLDPSSYWSVTRTGAQGNLVLRWVFGANDTVAFIGNTNGTLEALDATTGASLKVWKLTGTGGVLEPTFDYGDGISQGLIAATTDGCAFWIPLPPAPVGELLDGSGGETSEAGDHAWHGLESRGWYP